MATPTKLVIIGSGPAGLTAAIYAARADLEPIVITGDQPGGQLTTTTTIDNWPGGPEGIMGPVLMQNMMNQAEKFGATLVRENADSVDLHQSPFQITTSGGTTYAADAVILATGASPRTLGVPGEKEFWAKGVHTCATCDGFFYKGKEVAVIGGGDSAMEEALFLAKFATKVTVIHRRDALRASQAMIERAQNTKNIEWMWNSEVTAFEGSDHFASLALKNTVDGSTSSFKTDGAFLAIGHVPNTTFFKEFVATTETGYVSSDHPPFTSIDGVFVAGDVSDEKYRQAITAAGSGCKAALEAQWYLKHGR